jgi:homoserine dehydrogenase
MAAKTNCGNVNGVDGACGCGGVVTPTASAEAGVVVLKFGGSVLTCEKDVAVVAREIDRHIKVGQKVVAVVSALDGTTDRLISQAAHFGPAPDEAATALLLSTGELASAALLGLALAQQGTRAQVFTPGQVRLLTAGEPQDSLAIWVDRELILARLKHVECVVVPGFVGVDEFGATTLLGRGGSDLTALFLAKHLSAACRLVKDVDGLYDRDPAKNAGAQRYATASYSTALKLSGTVGAIVQSKAVNYAKEHGLKFEVGAIGRVEATIVGGEVDGFVVEASREAVLV